MKILCLLLVIMVCPWVAGAQSAPAKAVPPPGPLIAEAATNPGAWTIAYAYRDPEPNPQVEAQALQKRAESDPELAKVMARNPALLARRARVVEVKIIKTGGMKQEISVLSSGQRSERWLKDRLTIKKDAVTGKVSLSLLPEEFQEKDFADFAWVAAKNFREIQKVAGRECLIFSDTVPLLQVEDGRAYQQASGFGAGDEVLATAAIDLATRLPVSLEFAGKTRTYVFDSPPSAQLSLPADLAAEVQKAEKRLQSRNAGMSPP